ncbi:hypothetical protein PILCRDRAFT_818230 [Piloderma croceum F 1598]|uniref:Uncharacterized protein n=1 Tax=Piloderma croceum (strain F 1598) TaxID=765440 RepID=A0A0C3BEB4_PILCF|nr:hypothetical protein PILCRDRAFT_818230 [Piloderma croceum F 1598]
MNLLFSIDNLFPSLNPVCSYKSAQISETYTRSRRWRAIAISRAHHWYWYTTHCMSPSLLTCTHLPHTSIWRKRSDECMQMKF